MDCTLLNEFQLNLQMQTFSYLAKGVEMESPHPPPDPVESRLEKSNSRLEECLRILPGFLE